jgi:hypothetical protein
VLNSDLILDNWAALSHKDALNASSSRGVGPAPWSWVGSENARRLRAYMILEAYRRNVARWYVTASDEVQRQIRREYGDPSLLMRQVASSILGRGYRIAVDGADDEPAAQSQTDPSGPATGRRPATDRQEELARWSVAEQIAQKLLAAEHDCLSLGDSVFWLTYSARKKRARVKVIDPGFYFPVYPGDDDGEDFPSRVHLAWEFEQWDPVNRRSVPYIRRITFDLRDVPAYAVSYQSERATQQCYMTDATWTLDRFNDEMRNGGHSPDDFVLRGATFRSNDAGQEINDLPLGIDFIPVLHIPNFGGQPWGESIFTSVAHVIDDLQMADSDAAEAADVAGAPPIVFTGADASAMQNYGPKTAIAVPNGGQASVLDTGKGLDSLHSHTDRLFRRLTVNARIPREILGIVGAAEVPSGTALALAFNPYKVLISELRLSRAHKYSLLFKMVQRLMTAAGQWKGEVQEATLEFGAALPEDVAATVALVKELAAADRPIISRLTGLGMLADVGLPIEDPAAELDLVHEEDFDAGRLIQMATNSTEAAADHLKITLPDVTREEQAAIDAADQAAAMHDAASPVNDGATVADSGNTPNSSGTGTGTRDPDANGGSKNRNGNRRRRRGNQRGD